MRAICIFVDMAYETIKNIIKKIIPKSVLVSQERLLRKVVFIFYKGDNYECPVCEKKLKAFMPLAVGDELCAYCGSAARHRRLWVLLQPLLTNGTTMLDFSPPRTLYRKLITMKQIAYTPTDFANEFLASRQLDITQLELENESYNLITCYHVLEHVEEDLKAMRELYRVIKPSGSCFIQTPFKEGDIYENPAITLPDERIAHFGQDDHVRIYSVSGLMERLTSVGFKVERLDFTEKENNYYGFRQQETVLVARK